VQIFVLALYAAVYPALLAAVGILLASPRRLQLLTAFLLAGMTVSVCAGLGIVLLIHGSGAVSGSGSGWSWGTDLAVGLFALGLGAALGTHVPQRVRARRASRKRSSGADAAEKREPWSHRLLARGSMPIVVLAAVILNLPGAVYLVALKDIAAGHHSAGVDVLLVLAFNLIMFSLAEIPWLGLIVAPESTARLVKRAMTFLGVHGNKIATGLCLVVGVHLIVRAAIRS
jgi:hypothetical protein